MRLSLLFFFLFISLLKISSQAFYTIIDDDAANVRSIYVMKELADKKNIKISFAVIAERVLKNKSVCDLLRIYQQEGFHICNHSYTHSPDVWKTIDLQKICCELEESSRLLDSLGFNNHDYFVYPFGRFKNGERESIINLTAKYSKLAFNSRGGYNTFNTGNFNKYYINRFPLRLHDDWYVVKSLLDKAIEKNAWIVILTHSHHCDFSIKRLEKVVNYCQSKGLKAYTVHEAYQKHIQYEKSYDVSCNFDIGYEIKNALYMHWMSLFIFIIGLLSIIGVIIYLKKIL